MPFKRIGGEQVAPSRNHFRFVPRSCFVDNSRGAVWPDSARACEKYFPRQVTLPMELFISTAGRNAGLEEGMLLHLVHGDPNGGTTEAVRFQGQEPVADVRIFSVADLILCGRNHKITGRFGRG